ncbi:PIN domain-containing protein [Tenacibaculum sp. FZY0031]|uniref:PIN domain-containing protein n=1 Tax=Tenacibaculum sp. FZY0031 TaxID=3116648 RepID=UPI002E98B33C|nr:PIN domain-containing protein [Tenacibaculum sp. FZY0031]
MNLFIDTNILYPDPYWKNNFATEIIKLATEKKIQIFICDVVVEELKENFRKNLKEKITKLEKINLEIGKLLFSYSKIEAPNLEIELNNLENFIQKLVELENITLLKADKNDFYEILEKAIKKTKPFTEKRGEFKDAVIWSTYSKYVNKNNLKNCFFLSQNTADFYDKEAERIHPELEKECNSFTPFKSLNHFYKHYSSEFKNNFNWLSSKYLDPKILINILIKNDQIRDAIFEKTSNEISLNKLRVFAELFKGIPNFFNYDIDSLSWNLIKNITSENFKDYAIISGILNVTSDINIYQKNYLTNETLDDKSIMADIDIDFNFKISKTNEIMKFEINNIKIKGITGYNNIQL